MAQILTHSATLQAAQTNDNYAQVTTQNVNQVSAQNGWTLTVSDNIGFHWWISFNDNRWKFRTDTISILTFTIFTNSQFNGDDRDMLVIFSQGDSKYVTNFIPFDANGVNGIYPSCDTSSVPSAAFASGNIETLLNAWNNGQDRLYKSTAGNQYTDALPAINVNSSPLIFKIVNDPITGWSKYNFMTSTNSSWKQECGFAEMWSTNDFMEIFITGDDVDETLNIEKFEIFMEYNQTVTGN